MITAWESVVGEPVSPVCATTWSGSARSWSVSNDMLESLACGELELRNRFRRGRHHVGLLWPVTGRTLQSPGPRWKGQKGARCPRGSHMTDGRPQQPTTKQGDNGLQSWRLPTSPPVIVSTLLSSLYCRQTRHRFAPSPVLAESNGPTSHLVIKSHPNSQHRPDSPRLISTYGTPANSCNQMLPRDGTERHARLLYQLMIPSRTTGPQGDDLEPLSISVRNADPGWGLGWQYGQGNKLGKNPQAEHLLQCFAAPARSPPIMPERAPSRSRQIPASTRLARLGRLHSNHQTK